MGHLAWILRPSGPTHGRPPYSSLLSPGDLVPMVLNLIIVHLQYQTARRWAITSEEGPELGEITMCFIVHKTTSKLE
jgi:hypothetical protein